MSPDDAERFLPERLNLSSLQRAVQACTACPLHENATQAVLGEGLVRSRLMLVGEQPGDREDREGHPFVGPAGLLLDGMLEEAEIDREDAFVTNVVKHFKWKSTRSKRRIHDKPSRMEIKACEPWLRAELAVVDPEVVVCLGATAARSVIGSEARVRRDRGRFFEADEIETALAPGAVATLTLHPSAVLRVRSDAERREQRAGVVADLRAVAERL